MSNFFDELFGRSGHTPPHRRPHPRPKEPPRPAFIHRVILTTHYHHTCKRIHQVSRAQLAFTLPTTRTDGADLSPDEIASVDVFDDVGDGQGAQKIGTISGAGTSFATNTLSVGNHSFTVVVNDTTGHKSAPSNVAALTVAATLAAPSAVSDLTATLIDDAPQS